MDWKKSVAEEQYDKDGDVICMCCIGSQLQAPRGREVSDLFFTRLQNHTQTKKTGENTQM